jgi:pyruvate formate lyase activating enzyme
MGLGFTTGSPSARIGPPSARRGRVFDIQRYSIHDGPGIRTTVFLQGCPLSCPWCHNPESRSPLPEVRLIAGRCARCGACLEVCPRAPEPAEDGLPVIDPARCVHCGRCAEACPTGARRLAGGPVTVDQVLDAAERDRPFYEESGGGVTFSGGEPFLQAEFLLACLEGARRRGLHTAVDTCGYAPRETVLRAAAWTDLFLYDVKVVDPARHEAETGVPLAPILENLRALDAAGAAIWLRTPLVPGVNDSAEDLDALGRLAASLGRTRRIHLLPYHPLASEKYRGMGRPYALEGVARPSPERVEEAARRLRLYDLEVHIGG